MTGAAKKAAAPQPQPEVDEPKAEKPDSLVVVAARIQVAVGSQVLQFSRDDVLPNGIDEKSLTRLTDRGLIKKN